MRLDKYLKVSRLIKRRTVAAEACDSSRIFVSNKPAKPSKSLVIGDIISIHFGDNILRVKVLSITEPRRKDDILAMYEVVND